MSEYEPKLVCFSCKFSWGYLTDEDTLSSKIDNWVPIICTGKIDATHMLDAFKQGADGILILGCPEGDCHYQDGNYEAKKRVYLIRKLLESLGIEKERIRIELSIDPEGKRIPKLAEEMRKELAKLGPAKRSPVTEKRQKETVKARGGK
ncbi:MAG: hydrogenase iron-sulfur subunit [Dehalococcoidia bacterium]|nr:MAG: hydrogenase iron-sulfur subunit [Dehalococcoidia bacterium]